MLQDDGGFMDIARSKDGRVLWVRRYFDDDSTNVVRFTMEGTFDEPLTLHFVDGIVERRDPEFLKHALLRGRNVFKDASGVYELLSEAWAVNLKEGRATRRIRSANRVPDAGTALAYCCGAWHEQIGRRGRGGLSGGRTAA
jgi:hypothetical protein